MGNKRILDGKIRSSQTFIKLTYRQRDLWQGIIVAVDDQGRMPGSAMAVRSAVWPEDDILTSEVESDLQILEKLGNIYRYEIDGGFYLQIVNWWKYQSGSQWMSPSDFPSPIGWVDRARYHTKGNVILTPCWDKVGGFTGRQSIQDSQLDSREDSALDSEADGQLSCRDTEDDVKGDVKNTGGGGAKNPPNIFTLYEQNIGLLTPLLREKLIDAEKDFPPEWIPEAFGIAVQNNARSWAYIQTILDRWKVDGFKVDTRPKKNGKQTPNEPAGFAGIRAFLEEQKDVKSG